MSATLWVCAWGGVPDRSTSSSSVANRGADLTGATLSEVDAADATFDSVNFTGARLEEAELGSAAGADSTLANVDGADIADVTAATFVGANLQSARRTFEALPIVDAALLRFARLEQSVPSDPAAPYEISLARLDLSFVSITSAFDGALLKAVSLDGSTLDFTTFHGVDLISIDPTSIDLTDVNVDEAAICPDGSALDDPPLGTCVGGRPGICVGLPNDVNRPRSRRRREPSSCGGRRPGRPAPRTPGCGCG